MSGARLRSSLTLRFYVIGIVQLAALLAPAILLSGPRPEDSVGGFAAAVAAHYLRDASLRPGAMDDAMATLRREEGIDLSLYGASGALIASSVDPPLRADAPSVRSVHDSFTRPIELRGERALLVMRVPSAHRSLVPPPVLNFICGFFVVALGALLTGRWIVGPLRDLSRAARAIGAGELKARAVATRADEIGQVGVAFNEMAERVEAMMLAEKELLANVSHELRTPLARIRVAVHLAEEGDAKAAQSYLSEVKTDLAELEAMLDDIFVATRVAMSAGNFAQAGFALNPRRVPPGSIGERARDRFTARHARRELKVTIDPDLPDVSADPVLLRRVFDNLLENSHKYSPDSSSAIELRVRKEGAAVTFEVADHGAGIAAADLPKIFEPFFRGDRSRSRLTGGVGLGLTLVKRIVDAHGGTIEVASVAGEGTTMRVRIPEASE